MFNFEIHSEGSKLTFLPQTERQELWRTIFTNLFIKSKLCIIQHNDMVLNKVFTRIFIFRKNYHKSYKDSTSHEKLFCLYCVNIMCENNNDDNNNKQHHREHHQVHFALVFIF
jgi:hypothetical protein